MAGTFITFEGIDGSGKSTQLRLVNDYLKELGCEALTTREPGGTAIGLRLRAALLDAEEQVDPLTELLVFAARSCSTRETRARTCVGSWKVVISDRYADTQPSRIRAPAGDLNRGWFRK